METLSIILDRPIPTTLYYGEIIESKLVFFNYNQSNFTNNIEIEIFTEGKYIFFEEDNQDLIEKKELSTVAINNLLDTKDDKISKFSFHLSSLSLSLYLLNQEQSKISNFYIVVQYKAAVWILIIKINI